MKYYDLIATLGIGLILMAYFLNTVNLLKDRKLFFVLNVIGAAMACYSYWLIGFMPFVILQAASATVALFAVGERPKMLQTLLHHNTAGGAAAFGAAGMHPINAVGLQGLQQRLAGCHLHLPIEQVLHR